MNKQDRRKEEARKVEDQLRSEGRHFEADQIRNLRLSMSGLQETLRRVVADNKVLRESKGTDRCVN